MRDVHLEALVAGNAYEFRQAQVHAEAGLEAARVILAMDDPAVDALNEPWAGFEKLAGLSAGMLEDGGFSGRIEDLGGRFNVNSLIGSGSLVQTKNLDQFGRLLDLMDLPPEIIPPLLDWLDSDQTPRTGGAETPYYSSLDDPYPAGDRPFDTLGQLTRVKGWTPEILYGKEDKPGLDEVVTVHSDGRINVNTAGLKVLRSLDDGLTEQVAREIMDRRSAEPFEKVDQLKDVTGLTPATFARLAGRVSVASSFFLVRIEGRFRDARTLIEAVVRRTNAGTRIVYFRIG
jgi:general secretion pathway protein K